MADDHGERERFTLTFEALPSDRPVEVRVRWLLKFALRSQELKCVDVVGDLPPDAAQIGGTHEESTDAR